MPYRTDTPRGLELARASRRRHYHRNSAKYIEKSKQQKAELLAITTEAKKKPCVDCGVSYPPLVMDFDHRGDDIKNYNISQMTRFGSKRKLLQEIAKCDVVCANCHRLRTLNRSLQGSKRIPNP